MYLVFGRSKDSDSNTCIVVFVDRLRNMAHLAAVPDSIDGEGTALLFIDRVFRQHGLQLAIVSDCDLVLWASYGRLSLKCSVPDYTCLPRIIRRPVSE